VTPRRAAHPRPATAGATAALAWLGHPVTLLSLAVLVLNDHLLKAAYPGLVTGKLSDVAGLVLAPPLLAAVVMLLLPRVPGRFVAVAALVATGVGFTVVNASPAGAAAASHLWSLVAGPSRMYADLTDLFTLPALLVAWWVWRRVRHREVPPRFVRLARVLIVLPVATMAVAATSIYEPAGIAVTEWQGGLAAGEIGAGQVFDDPAEPVDWRFSDDGGRTWRWLDRQEREALREQVPAAETVRQRGCVRDVPAHCYRVVEGRLAVEESFNGGATWRTSWEVTDEQRQRLARHYPYVDDLEVELSSRALVVHTTEAGHVVLVANGWDGFALRTEDGEWRRIGFGDSGLQMPHWDDRFTTAWVPYGVLMGLVAGMLCLLIAVEVTSRPGSSVGLRLLSLPGVATALLGVGVLLAFNEHGGTPDPLQWVFWMIGWAIVAFGLVLWLVVPIANRALSGVQWLVVAPASLMVGVAVAVPSTALEADHAVAVALLLWGIGTTVTATVAWRVDQPPVASRTDRAGRQASDTPVGRDGPA
jgi:hypothetical protein